MPGGGAAAVAVVAAAVASSRGIDYRSDSSSKRCFASDSHHPGRTAVGVPLHVRRGGDAIHHGWNHTRFSTTQRRWGLRTPVVGETVQHLIPYILVHEIRYHDIPAVHQSLTMVYESRHSIWIPKQVCEKIAPLALIDL